MRLTLRLSRHLIGLCPIHKALALADEWTLILSAWRWLDERGAAKYLRQITALGVDSKFVERHPGPCADAWRARKDGFGSNERWDLIRNP